MKQPDKDDSMSTNSRSSSIWNDFYQTYGRSLAKSAGNDVWKPLVTQALWRNDFVVPFFALARYEAAHGEPLVIRADDHDTCVGKIANDFGFKYPDVFTNNRERLSQQLSSFQVVLMESTNGWKQYLRTIHKLSGAVYLKVAKTAVQISPDKWIVDGHLNKLISDDVRKYSNEGEGDEGDDGLMSDVCAFFRVLRKRFRRFNSLPTVDAFRNDAPELSEKMLKSILKTLDPRRPQPGNGIFETIEEPRPVFWFDDRSRIVLGFRSSQTWHFDVDASIRTIQFVFKRRKTGFGVNDDGVSAASGKSQGCPDDENRRQDNS